MRVDEETHQCEVGATKCGRPAPYGYVCYQCIDDTQARLDEVTPEQMVDLLMISRGEAKPANRNLIKGGGAHRMDALNVAAYSLLHDLRTRWPAMLPTLHRDPDAVWHLGQIEAGVEAAHQLTKPQEEDEKKRNHIEQKMREIHNRRPEALCKYMFDNMGIRITVDRIYKWRERGKIKPRETNKWGDTWYHPVDVLRALDNMEREPAA